MTASSAVPEISRFLGMFFREHGPAHFHATYGEYSVTVEIESGRCEGISRHERSVSCSNGLRCTGEN